MDKMIDCEKFVEYEKKLIKGFNINPSLVIINASFDEASRIYLNNKEKLCKELGININIIKYNKTITEQEIINKIIELNDDKNINGIMIQLPLYDHLNKDNIINTIKPTKDVDGLTTINKGLLINNTPMLIPCTALGIMKLLEFCNVDLEGKNVVILGRTELVGLPLFSLLTRSNATVTVCHSKTKDITRYTKEADILISAIGKPKYITKDMIKEDSILIDVGVSKKDNKIYGDIDFDDVYDKCKLVTKVPNGIGIVTTIILMYNVILAYKIQKF